MSHHFLIVDSTASLSLRVICNGTQSMHTVSMFILLGDLKTLILPKEQILRKLFFSSSMEYFIVEEDNKILICDDKWPNDSSEVPFN